MPDGDHRGLRPRPACTGLIQKVTSGPRALFRRYEKARGTLATNTDERYTHELEPYYETMENRYREVIGQER